MIFLENIIIKKRNLLLLKNTPRKKRFKKYAIDLQKYFNKWVDDMILKDLEYTNQIEAEIEQALIQMNSRPLTESYKKIINNNNLSLYQERKINKERLEDIADAVMEGKDIFKNNSNFIHDVLNAHDVDLDKYSKLILDYPLNYNRKVLLDKSISDGINTTFVNSDYMNIENIAENNFQATHSATDFESAELSGADEKEWVWSGYDNSRHEEMGGVVVDMDSPFPVINSISGDMDYLMFPQDPSGSPANTYNCACDVIYYKNGEEL